MIRSIQILIADIVENAKSGHPGSAISLTPFYFTLTKHLRYDPDDYLWADRDIVAISNGHTCLIYYVILHLMRFDSQTNKLTLQQLIDYRKMYSLTPGHPETQTPGIEVCTGPLGQGLANSNGFALSQEKVKSSGVTFCIFGDGCYQEGISHEAFALASMYSKCTIFVYDNNKVTIDGSTKLSMNECPIKRFQAYGFYVVEVVEHDLEALDDILRIKLNYLRSRHDENKKVENSDKYDENELCSDKLLMIVLNSTIASGTMHEGDAKTHGAPIGKEAIDDMKKRYNMTEQGLEIKKEVYDYFSELNKAKRMERKAWNEKMEKAKQEISDDKEKAKNYPFFCYDHNFDWTGKNLYHYKIDDNKLVNIAKEYLDKAESKKLSTRKALTQVLKTFDTSLPFLLSGSADLTPSCLTKVDTAIDIAKPSLQGNYIRYGIREHGMFGMMKGISAHGFFLPLGSTFLNFISYGWHGIRLTSLAQKRAIYIATHDSICLGEDGPTHQPIETLALARATPGMQTFRPCDIKELFGCFIHALKHEGPSLFALSRQDIEDCSIIYKERVESAEKANSTFHGTNFEQCLKGAYYIYKTDSDMIIYATGAEVPLALKVAVSIGASLVSFPCFELFELNEKEYIDEIIHKNKFKVSVEALSSFGWQKYVDLAIGVNDFGLSGKWQDVYVHFGFEENALKERIDTEYKKWKESKIK